MFRVSLAAGHHKVLVNYMKCEQDLCALVFFFYRYINDKKKVNKAKECEKKMKHKQLKYNGKIYEKTFYLSVVQPPTVTKTSTKHEMKKKTRTAAQKTLIQTLEGKSDYFCEWLYSFRTRSFVFFPFLCVAFYFLLMCVCVYVRVFFAFLRYDLLKYRKKKTITRKIYVQPFTIR